jgi:hypothetical protein
MPVLILDDGLEVFAFVGVADSRNIFPALCRNLGDEVKRKSQ